MRAIYRVWQGLRSLAAKKRREDWALVERYLSAPERSLFEGMQAADQQHGVRVLRSLLARGITDRSLLKAALLHDVGKSSCQIRTFHRAAAVLATALLGGLPRFLSDNDRGGCFTAFYVIANHPKIGATMLARAGSEARVCRLTELHQMEPRAVETVSDGDWVRWALALLRQADNES